MEDIKNKDNLTAMVTYREGFSSGDVAKVLSVLSPAYTFQAVGQPGPAITRDQFAQFYPKFRAQQEAAGGPPASASLEFLNTPGKAIITEWKELLFLSATLTVPGFATSIVQLAYKGGKVLWEQALIVPLADKAPKLGDMGQFSNIGNFNGVKTLQLGWASGDVSLIMSVLDPSFTFTITGQTTRTKDEFPEAYAQFRKQIENDGGLASSSQNYKTIKKMIIKQTECDDLTIVSEEFEVGGFSCLSNSLFQAGLCLWTKVFLKSTGAAKVMTGAVVAASAVLGPGVLVEASAVVGEGVKLSAGARVEEGAVIEEGATVGAGALIKRGVVVKAGTEVAEGTVVN